MRLWDIQAHLEFSLFFWSWSAIPPFLRCRPNVSVFLLTEGDPLLSLRQLTSSFLVKVNRDAPRWRLSNVGSLSFQHLFSPWMCWLRRHKSAAFSLNAKRCNSKLLCVCNHKDKILRQISRSTTNEPSHLVFEPHSACCNTKLATTGYRFFLFF